MKNKKITLFCAAGVITLFLNGCVQTKPQSQPPYIGAERAKNTFCLDKIRKVFFSFATP